MIIKNYNELVENRKTKKGRILALKIINSGIKAVLPKQVIHDNVRLDKQFFLKIKNKKFDLKKFKRILVIGAGKASAAMAEELEKILGNKITTGYINSNKKTKTKLIKINIAGHPIPNEAGLKGVKKILKLITNLTKQDLVICLISGGGSAMMPLPAEKISLEEMQKVTNLLLKCGADIKEVNAVRKHLSRVKGGQLTSKIYPATTISLILSDVIGDDLSVIASGPTNPDNSTFKQVLNILKKYHLLHKLPESVIEHIKNGIVGRVKETPKKEDKIFKKVHNFIIGNNATALKAMKLEAEKLGLEIVTPNYLLKGEAKREAENIAFFIKKIKKKNTAIILGGETTVKVVGSGVGGRNQELILALVEKIRNKSVVIVSVGTDGVDFVKEAAGAIADQNTFEKASETRLNMREFLNNNNSYNFFKKLNDVVVTGHTGTNVCDIFAGVVL